MIKYSVIFLFISILGCAASCRNGDEHVLQNEDTANKDTTMSNKIKITINSKTFTATLFDNNSAKALKERLPMTITMIELNGNEKYYNLASNLFG